MKFYRVLTLIQLKQVCCRPLVLAIFLLCLTSHYAQASELLYTVQTASFEDKSDAHKAYRDIIDLLDEPDLNYLRVENIGRYYAVRLGAFERYAGAVKLLENVQGVLPSAFVMEAYIKYERLVQVHGEAKVPRINVPDLRLKDTELVYTIQAASYAGPKDAGKYFKSIGQAINKEDRDLLRIEKIGDYYTIRLGRFERYDDAREGLASVRDAIPGASITEAYIKVERVVALYESDRSDEAPDIEYDYEEVVMKAKERLRSGAIDDALGLLQKYTADHLKYPVAVSDYIVGLVWQERFSDAVKMYEGLPVSFTKRVYLIKNISKAYYELRDFEKSLAGYQDAHKEMPSDGEVQKGIVYSLLRLGRYEDGLVAVEKFIAGNPGSVELGIARAELLQLQGQYADALAQYRDVPVQNRAEDDKVRRLRRGLVDSLSDEDRKTLTYALSEQHCEGDLEDIGDYLYSLSLNRDYETIIDVADENAKMYVPDIQARIAWAHFKFGNTERAEKIYRDIVAETPEMDEAQVGLAYCFAKLQKKDEAFEILDRMVAENRSILNVRFARAYAFEQAGMFWDAVEEYDLLLKLAPGNISAQRLRFMALSDLGATTHADDLALKNIQDNKLLRETFQGDMAADRIIWKEFPVAIAMLKTPVEKKNLRARYDYIVALVENYDMQEAVNQYEALVEEKLVTPQWVMESSASAYLYLEKPHKALELYERVLETDPWSYNARMGRFYVLQELRRWDEARALLEEVDQEEPEFFQRGRNRVPNWRKMEIALAKGWLLTYEDRLKEGQPHFEGLHEMAPENTNIRSGAAHTYLWRGWPRKALEEFLIIENLDPKDREAQVGKIHTLNQLAYREEARKQADALLKRYPKDKHVQSLVRQLELEEMTMLEAEFVFGGDDDGFQGISSKITLTEPVTLHTNLKAYMLWNTAETEELRNRFQRAGAGVEHTLNSYLRFKQMFSFDFNTGSEFGSYSEIFYTPDDYWEILLSYDSFSTDVPLRARVFDIEADMLNLDLAYVESDWRTYSLSLSREEFSDGNERLRALFGYEQGLWTRDNWRERIFLDLGISENSRSDAPYFNPDSDFSFSVTHMTEHTVRRIYRRAFMYRIYLTAGGYKQDGFSLEPIASLRYEHDFEISDTHSLLYGASIGSQAYDGDSVTGYTLYLNWRLLF
ncbi:tetratricopeptide repeat protein [bacterium]|nr:tetratricopeptide repeat protein [bacterium]